MHEPDPASRVALTHAAPATAFGEAAGPHALPILMTRPCRASSPSRARSPRSAWHPEPPWPYLAGFAALAFWAFTHFRRAVVVRFPTPRE
jgi:hypothetical protein